MPKQINIRKLPDHIRVALKVTAAKREISFNSLVVEILTKWIEKTTQTTKGGYHHANPND